MVLANKIGASDAHELMWREGLIIKKMGILSSQEGLSEELSMNRGSK